MPASRRTPWLLCYDIASPRRLQRVHRVACRHATPFQRSVFHTVATRHEILAMIHEFEECIDPDQDDVRAYPLTTAVPVTFGRDRLASGVMLCYPENPGLAINLSHVSGQHVHMEQVGSTRLRRHCFSEGNGEGRFKPQT